MSDVIVRPARQSELGAVGELRVDAYNAQNLLSLNPPYADTLRTLGTDGRGEVLVAVDGAGLLGTIMLDPWHPNSEVARGPEEAEIRGLAVAPAAQGRGVGARLVRAVIDRATERGARLLLLSTLPIMAAAQRLYVASGFTRLPDRDWSPRPGVTLLAFCRTLDE